ncbi:hypothetical protein PILCRDRAFT_1925 [Piloderma croceum F 1598]|uniref:DUF6533 domain-containing protein n=1 Tax=Piloderma croceum (strain F 1598) TaxID=765440 RepID=A0A0C3GG09_PILCF|nr:hypothetical protein PILCRDRAFT_1925 [Piloderma croceum F 1598]
MSAPSTTSYYPFDSEASTVFKATKTNNYLRVVFMTLLLYDHAITLDKEVEWIWTLRWRLPKIAFFLNRYVICPLIFNLIINRCFRGAFLSVEGVLTLLTAYKVFSYRNQMNQTVAMLARDSVIYFIVIFACLTLEIVESIDLAFVFDVATPAQCIGSIAVGRMMMNIRGLIMDDPEHTTHLQTLQFATRTHAGSEIEEGTGDEA